MNRVTDRTEICIRLQDILLIAMALLMLFNRHIPLDYSSVWQSCLLLLVYLTLRATPSGYSTFFLSAVYLWGFVETIIALCQKYGIAESHHPFFNMTGTFGNPAPLAGLLALCCILSLYLSYIDIRKKCVFTATVHMVTGTSILYVLLLSQSRAAGIAALTGCFFFAFPEMKQIQFVKTRPFLSGVLLFLSAGIFVSGMYLLKKDSADGRLLIWNNTLDLFTNYPLSGAGTGGWLANYMHYQADYFTRHPDSVFTSLADNAGYPYNEFLYLAAEQGVTGLFLVALLLCSLFIHTDSTQETHVKKALIAAFCVFALFSYPLHVFPLKLLFVALIATMRSPIIKGRAINPVTLYLSGSLVFLCIICTAAASYAVYHRASTRIALLGARETLPEKEIRVLDLLYPFYRNNPDLMHRYAQTCPGKYPTEKTLTILQDAAKIVPTCELYCLTGDSWMQKKEPVKAGKYYRTAALMIPYRFTPRYNLFRLYVEQGDTARALQAGHSILKLPVKKEGTKVLRIKAEIRKYIQETQP